MPDELIVSGVRSHGYGQLPKIVMLDSDLTIEAKGIYAYFASFTGNGNTKAFPGRDKIIHDLNVSKDTYYRHFNSLVDAGYITVEQVSCKGQKGFSHNIYTLVSLPEKYKNIPADAGSGLASSYVIIREVGDISAAGYGNVPKSVMTDTSISIQAKALYAYLSVFSGTDFTASPSVETAAYHLNVSKNTYNKYVKILESANYISRMQSQTNGQFGRVIYYLNQDPYKENKTKDTPYTKISDTLESYTLNTDAQISDSLKADILNTDTQKPDALISDANIPSNKSQPKDINTNIINQSVRGEKTQKKSDSGLTDMHNDVLSFSDIKEKIISENGIPEEFLDNTDYISCAVDILTSGVDNNSCIKIFRKALVEMLTAKNGTNIQGNIISADDVRKQISANITSDVSGERTNVSFTDIDARSLERFIKFSSDRDVKNPVQYMKNIIWTELMADQLRPETKVNTGDDSPDILPQSIRKK